MKLRYLFSIILSSVLVFASCEEQNTESWDNIKLDQTYLSIDEKGGSATLTIDATEDWAFVTDDVWPEVIKRDKEGNIESSTPSWLSADKMSGAAGQTKVTFSAEATASGRELELKIKAGDNTQFIRVRQGSMTVTKATVAEIIAGPEGKLYEVSGVCTSIANTNYGNWYLKDDTSKEELYIYGTVDGSGKYNWSSFNIEVGDVVTVQGSYVLYGGNTHEFVDATFIKVEKSLVKLVTKTQTVPKEGGEIEVKVAYKGAGVFPTVSEEYRSWISVVDMQDVPGTPTKIDPNPADTAVVRLAVQPNAGGDRSGSVTFASSGSSVPYEFTQEGSIINATIPEFLAAAENATQYRVSGWIKSINVSASYHNANVTIEDVAGNELYLYRLVTTEGNIEDYGFKEGDQLTVVGKRSSYNGSPQMAQGCYVESYAQYTAATVSEFLKASVGKTWFRLTGKVANIKNTTFGNFDLVDETGTVYVYGLTATPVASNDKSFASLGIKEGDIITIAGTRADYKGTAQVGGPAYIISHEAGAGNEDVKVGPFTSNISWTANKDNKSYDDGGATVNGTELDKVLKFGTSSVVGEATITVPAGTKKIGYWGVAWNGKNGTITAKVGGTQIYSQNLTSNAGASNQAPYTITVTDSDYYEINLDSALAAETQITLATVSGATRVILWGLNAYTE